MTAEKIALPFSAFHRLLVASPRDLLTLANIRRPMLARESNGIFNGCWNDEIEIEMNAIDEAMSVVLLSAWRVYKTLQADSLPVTFSGVGCYLTLPFLGTHASSVEADGTDVISSSMSLDLPDDEDEYVS
ncbi:hypothetical protein T02_14772 [Trichinella nativa]|uniref:Uncharacterized protein n=1 Tax=Trichinella nativa TaxID=6335 RepID=A0A0V1L2A6_9BILA|nr:hypothetical protein T02_14772 [Trichinella nativa]